MRIKFCRADRFEPQSRPAIERLEDRRLLSSTVQWQPLGEPGSGGRIDAIAVSPHDPSRVLVAGDILGTGLSEDAGQTWQPTTGFASWEHSDFTFHPTNPNVVWAATLSGPHLSSDGGHTWAPRRAGLPADTGYGYPAAVEKILYDAGDATHNTLLAFGGDHRRLKDSTNQVPNYGKVWRSQNGGTTWSELSGLNGNIVAVAPLAGSHEYYWAAVADKGLFLTSNDGESGTWTAKNNGLPTLGATLVATSVLAHPTQFGTAYATIATIPGSGDKRGLGGIFKTVDTGATWTRVEAGVNTPYNSSAFFHLDISGDGNTLWAGDISYESGKGMWRSTNGGDNWSRVLDQSNIDQLVRDGVPFKEGGTVATSWVEIDPNDPTGRTAYFGTTSSVFKTSDGGASWEYAVSGPTGNGTFRGNGYTGWVGNNVEFSPYDPNLLFAQGWDALLAGVSRDAGFSWKFRQPGLPQYSGGNDVTFAADGTIFAALRQNNGTSEHVARSRDAGATWQVLPTPTVGGSAVNGVASSIHVNPSNAAEVWVAVAGRLFHSTNATAASASSVVWSEQTVGASVRVDSIVAGKGQAGNFFVATGSGVYRTVNGGASFQSTDTAGAAVTSPRGKVSLTVDPSDPSVVWAACNGQYPYAGLYRYDGTSWTNNATFGLPAQANYWAKTVAVDPTNSNRVVLLTSQDPYVGVNQATGVWFSRDGGLHWTSENANLPILRAAAATFSPDGGRVLIGTGGRGFFTADFDRTTVGAQAERLTIGESGGRSFALGSSGGAQGGRYLAVPDAQGDNGSATADAPVVTFAFTLAEANNGVRFRGRVQSPAGGTDDSFFVRVDKGPWQLWDTPHPTSGWAWGNVRNRGASGDYAVNLAAGPHSVQFKLREAGTRLDAVEVVLPTALTAPRRADAGPLPATAGTRLLGAATAVFGDNSVTLTDDGLLDHDWFDLVP